MPDPAVLLEGGAKALIYASLLVIIGASAARWLLLPRAAAELGGGCVAAIEQRIAHLAFAAAVLALAASGLRVWTHTVSAFGFDGARSWETIKLIAWQSRWGQDWKFQMIAAFILVVTSAMAWFRREAWPLATLATLVFTATLPLLGHAAGNGARMALHAVHILGAGFWLGTLAVVLLIRIPAASPDSMEPRLASGRARLLILRRFSPIALSSAMTMVGAGLVIAFLYLGSVSNLWTTAYGRILILKVALVVGVAICGYVNWKRLRRMYDEDEPSTAMVVLEVTLAAVVLIVTGFLTEMGHPA